MVAMGDLMFFRSQTFTVRSSLPETTLSPTVNTAEVTVLQAKGTGSDPPRQAPSTLRNKHVVLPPEALAGGWRERVVSSAPVLLPKPPPGVATSTPAPPPDPEATGPRGVSGRGGLEARAAAKTSRCAHSRQLNPQPNRNFQSTS